MKKYNINEHVEILIAELNSIKSNNAGYEINSDKDLIEHLTATLGVARAVAKVKAKTKD